MTGNSVTHKHITMCKHTKKVKSLCISVKQRGMAGTRVLEHNINIPKHKGYLPLTTKP